ncbi:hypothetical protein P167DRAFT_571555 [Morchella conica CCBAS932]|uniref:Uncharacterized protein n=1 Tax=Morchella conica CCBAS932 TaxID=1392247 RepID=A0A3N4L1W2_9PEZI|nr:hypothetical protein P167DRAFT_571555 [Morchella conica CCBAS932]
MAFNISHHSSSIRKLAMTKPHGRRADEVGHYATREQLNNERIEFRRSLATLDKDIAVLKLQLDRVKTSGDYAMERVENSIKRLETRIDEVDERSEVHSEFSSSC